MKQNTSWVSRVEWVRSIPYISMHLALVSVFFVPFSWGLVALCMAMYVLRMFGITASYHRYFSHRTYKMGRVAQFCMAWLGSMAMQKGVLWWAANHRHHHKYSDQEQDVHSPRKGLWWSHVGWILVPDHSETRWELIKDFSKYPELVWLNKYHLIPCAVMAAALYWLGGFPAVVWGEIVSTVLLWNGTSTINSLSHVFGSRRYQTTDDSKNNFILALITLGEGWHNNHHHYMSSTNQGFFWWEIDVSYYVLKGMSFLGITKDLRKPPAHVLNGKGNPRLDASPLHVSPIGLAEDV